MAYLKKIFLYLFLTYVKKGIVSGLLKVNKPVASKKRVLPTGSTKGIIALTLVISRVPDDPAVRRGICRMWNFFKVKTKLEIQVEEYIEFKAKTSPYIADDQKEIINYFIKGLRYKEVAEIKLEDLDTHHIKLQSESSPYTTVKAMQALRAFMRHHKRQTDIKPDEITNQGVTLNNVAKNDIIQPMIRKKRVGRPLNVAFIKEVKIMKDKAKLGFQEIANIQKERGVIKTANRGYIYRTYHKDISKLVA